MIVDDAHKNAAVAVERRIVSGLKTPEQMM